MKKTIVIGLITMIMILYALVMAARYDHPASGVSIWFPDDWQIKSAGQAYYAISPDGSAAAKYIHLEARDLRHAREVYRNYLDPQIRNIQVIGNVESFELHKMMFELIHAEAREQLSLTGQRSPMEQRSLRTQQPREAQQPLWKIKIYLITAPKQIGMLVLRHREGTADQKIPFTNILESIKPQ